MKPFSALKIILFALSLGMLAACEKAAYDDEESIKKDDTHIIEGDDDGDSDQQDNGGTGGSSTDTTNFTDYPEDTTYQDHTTPIIDPNVEDGNDKGYKLHLVYGAKAAPSSKAYATINESPEAITLSWELTTTPVPVTGKKPTAIITIDSTKADASKLSKLLEILYGKDPTSTNAGDGVAPRLPLPDEVATIFSQG